MCQLSRRHIGGGSGKTEGAIPIDVLRARADGKAVVVACEQESEVEENEWILDEVPRNVFDDVASVGSASLGAAAALTSARTSIPSSSRGGGTCRSHAAACSPTPRS